MKWMSFTLLLIMGCGPGYYSYPSLPSETSEVEEQPAPRPTECYCWEKPVWE